VASTAAAERSILWRYATPGGRLGNPIRRPRSASVEGWWGEWRLFAVKA